MTDIQVLETTAGALSQALSIVRRQMSRRNALPILDGILIDGHQVIADDLDRRLSITFGASRTLAEPIVCHGRQLANLVRLIDRDETIRIGEPLDEELAVDFNGAHYHLVAFPAADYPDTSKDAVFGTAVQVANAGLVRAMRRVAFAMSREETWYYLNGICLSTDLRDRPCVVATDGQRMAIHPIPFEIEGGAGRIIPLDTIKCLEGIGKEPETIAFGEPRFCRFAWPGMTLDSRLIDGTYPDFRKVIHPTVNARLAFRPDAVRACVKRIIASDISGAVGALRLSVDRRGARLEYRRMSHGAVESFEAAISGDPFEVGINPRYLLDVLDAFRSAETLVLATTDNPSSDAMVFFADGDDLTVVQMPMRI
jgi:DNA polymerase-3 subunit beta